MKILQGTLGVIFLLALGAQGAVGEIKSEAFPRFASLRAEEVYLRVGPGLTYPIQWVYQRKNLPIQILGEFGHWRKVRDWQGTLGWVHYAMLSSKRTAMVVRDDSTMHEEADDKSPIVARLQRRVLVDLLECPSNSEWCRLEVKTYKGWVRKRLLWGLRPQEVIE